MRSRFFVVVVLLLIVSEAFQAIAGVSTSNKVCGRPRRYSGLIIGGSNFTRGDFPWIVALMYKSMSSPKFICGGTIITTKHVITGKRRHSLIILAAINKECLNEGLETWKQEFN